MKANELRVGNLVFYDSEIRVIKGIRIIKTKMVEFQMIDLNYVNHKKVLLHLKELNHIPLTEEWLFKFGFEKKPDMQYIWTSKVKSWWFIRDFLIIQMFINFNGIIDFRFNYPSSEPANFKFIEILYIHQLQNLYFALTGEELTIKI